MKIIDKTERKPEQVVKNLKVGTLYRLTDSNYDADIIYMVTMFGRPAAGDKRSQCWAATRCSVVLNTGVVILWNGHEEMSCVAVDAELVVKGELK